ncbi:MAG: SDR family NAD(P)-dependent oxidoreductase [Proteobacteria bacterium]|nr:SDR family NAD(P)-dependent oxidoreductase [Pseudomonadota bacterium]
MKTVKDKTAFVTGGASGIGLGMVKVFLRNGMKVVVADIRQDHLDGARRVLSAGRATHFIRLDVADRDAWQAAADEAERVFGRVHVLCNNAGVGSLGDVRKFTYSDWDWNLQVNLGGAINGIQTFLSRMLAHGEEAHIVNTSSMGALMPMPGGAAYIAAKSAISGLTEALRCDLDGSNVGVTLLIPGPTQTNIHEVAQLRPEKFRDSGLHEVEADLAQRKPPAVWLDPVVVGEMVLQAILHDRLFLITHNEFVEGVRQRFEATMTGFPPGPPDPEKIRQLGFDVTNRVYAQILRDKS